MSAPQLRFKEFSGDWKEFPINTLFKFKQGKQVPIEEQSLEKSESAVRFIRIVDLTSLNEKPRYIVDFSEKDLVKADDLFMVRYGSPGTLGFGYEGVIANNLFKISPVNIDQIFPKYSYYIFDFLYPEIEKLSSSTTMPAINFSSLKALKIRLCSFDEQTKIASFLSAVDEKISQLNQKHQLLSQYKQGMMQKLFSQQIRFKADDGSEFGEWEKFKFSEKFNFYNTNSYSRALLSEQGEIMNIHYGDIHTKFSMLFDIEKETVPFLNESVDLTKISKDQFLQVGDLVIADASEDYKDIGKTIEIIALNNQKVVAGLHTYIARPTQPFALGFCGYLMQTFEVREQIKKLATGISVLGISKTNIGKVEIKLPCLEEQTKIANFLSSIDQKIEVVAQQIEQAKQWKKGLLQQMFV